MTRTGRVAALLNCHEETSAEAVSKVSRGLFTKDYLKSDLDTKTWMANTIAQYGSEGLAQAGGFTMFCGQVVLSEGRVGPFGLFSNRANPTWVLNKGYNSICVSNGVDESWNKTEMGDRLLQTAVAEGVNDDEDRLVDKLFGILSTNTYPIDNGMTPVYNLRKSIFIPKIEFEGADYGTRTQTVILVDVAGTTRYIEKNLVEPLVSEYKFRIRGFSNAI
jgi:uncharacterized protein with NRDE domain